MNVLVGYTGFVGSNLFIEGCFDRVYNSKNIEEAFGLRPDLLVFAGLRAEKYLANTAPEKDMGLIQEAEMNITKIAPKKLILISTIDVFSNPADVDEDTEVSFKGLNAYGYNRYQMECWVRKNYPDALIIRLPGLFGRNIKKNFIYDYIKRIPYMLKKEKFKELVDKSIVIKDYYELTGNGFYKCKVLINEEELILKNVFNSIGFTALNFTDSRSIFQFYPLNRLWSDIQIALNNNILLLHLATEPVSAGEIFEYLEGEKFINYLNGLPSNYNFKTKYYNLFCGKNGYICNKDNIKKQISEFVNEEKRK